MTTESTASFDVALIGMGVRSVAHMTLQAIEILKQCKRGFVVALDQQAVEHFRESILEHLKPGDSLPPLESLSRAYKRERFRSENYAEAGKIVLEAMQLERPIAYLTPGNPVTFDSVCQEILQGVRHREGRALVVPGISSVDTILVDIQQEMAPGVQIFEASWAVGARARLDTRFACLLLQTGVFCTNLPMIGQEPQTSALIALKDYLLQFYPIDHLVVLVRSGSRWNDLPNIHPLALDDLGNVPINAQLGASLFIPPLEMPELDPTFREKMSDLRYLKVLCPDVPEKTG
jgi:precorrin-2 methylase